MNRWVLLSPRLLLIPLAFACDDLDLGRAEEEAGPPKLVRVLVQDEDRRGGRSQVTDLLNTAPDVACGPTSPCPSTLIDPETGGPVECAIEDGATAGVCPDATKPSHTPPQVGTPVAYGGVQIRLVFSKGLDPAMDAALADPATRFVSLERDGEPLDLVTYLDPAGSPSATSDAIREPYGPAIVLKPELPLAPATEYMVKLDASKVRDRAGQAASQDARGPIQATYSFTTEAFHARGLYPDFTSELEITSEEALQVELNADVSADTGTVSVSLDGSEVAVRWFADCDSGPRLVNLIPIDEAGAPSVWTPGEYALSFALVSADSSAPLKADPFGSADLAGAFTVPAEGSLEQLNTLISDLVLPEDCQ
ncbi:MAG: hypothetical protein HY791_29785 [Deltaproteobacteria bacterium]|nr:hypothetical protein [Deltaproteobacteria bacterium]